MRNSSKIFLITNIPTPYRLPLFNELNRQLKIKGLSLTVLFGAHGYANRKWKIDISKAEFDYRVLNSKKIQFKSPENLSLTYSGLFKIISEERPLIVVGNGFSLATSKLWLRSFIKTNPYLIWSEAIENKNKPISFLRKLQRKLLVRGARGFIASGTRAKDYLISLGANPGGIEIGINTVDNDFFGKSRTNRKDIHYDIKKHLLYVGQLNPRKNVLKLLKTVTLLSRNRSDFILDIVGDGEERGILEEYVKANKLGDFVKFHGFKQVEEISLFYSQSDCFLFQTDFDVWGLVLVEAMAAGLPCIASIHAGATHDLVIEGETGFAVDFLDTNRVVKKINWVLDNVEQSQQIGRNASLFIANNVNLKLSASGFVRAILRVFES
jgi:glycosyltransferase involved in cell wall biosynthesis